MSDRATAGKSPRVSVHIISYNQEDYIAEAIESAVSQNYRNLEVVVSDDASTDQTPEIIASFARQYPGRVVPVLNRQNAGITANSNRGLRACSGEYIAFMGGDDVLLPGKIVRQVEWLEADPRRVLCGHQVEVFYEVEGRAPHPLTKRLTSGAGADEVIRHGTFGATAIMVRASKIPPHGFDEQLPTVSDHMLWTEVLADGGLFGYIEGTWARYRRHASNVTNDPLKNIADVEKYLELIVERYPRYVPSCLYAYARRILYNTGVALLEQGRRREARRNFRAAAFRDPLFVRAWVRYAQTFAKGAGSKRGIA